MVYRQGGMAKRLYMGSYKGLAILAMSCAVTASACGEIMKPAQLQGTWVLSELNGVAVVSAGDTRLPSFTISGTSISGFDGCNDFSGKLDQPGSIVSTQLACASIALALPIDLSDPMKQLQTATMAGDRLGVAANDSLPSSTYVRKK